MGWAFLALSKFQKLKKGVFSLFCLTVNIN